MHGAAITMTRNIRRVGIPATKRGRPRKVNVTRDASGKSRGEILDLSVVMNQPHRRAAKGDARKSELLGYPLGRLRFTGEISEDQLQVGNEWALMVRAYAGMNGIRIGSPRSGSALDDSGKARGVSFEGDARGDAEEYEKRVLALRSRYNDAFERLAELGQSLGRSTSILIAVRRVCIEERDPTPGELGDLRLGLNALMKLQQEKRR